MKKIMKNILILLLFAFPSVLFASEPLVPATNTSCNSAMLICPDHTSQSFDNWVSDSACPPGFVDQYYYMYINSTSASFTITSSGLNMLTFNFYGPLSNNLPDACETYTQNSAMLLASNLTSSGTNNYSSTSPLQPGIYLVVLRFNQCLSGSVNFLLKTGEYLCSPQVPCENCVASFELAPDTTYMISAWVKEEGAPVTKTSYDLPLLKLVFKDNITVLTTETFTASGVIIDGWQRIEGEFTVPANTDNMEIRLEVLSGEAYFDDIRIFPFDGSMKSYVYDPISLRLVAELDERNYATIYEYDEEGKLVRVKKETERGIMTIQENKTFIKKQ